MNYENRYLVYPEGQNPAPGDIFGCGGITWEALTYPYGTQREVLPGVFVDMGMYISKEERGYVKLGTLLARKISE